MNRWVTAACLFTLMGALAAPLVALNGPCYSCLDYGNRCHGWTGSDCTEICICAAPSGSSRYLQLPQPGLLATRSFDELVVSGVVAGSPASAAGILAGDHVLLIDGKKPTDA